MQSLNAKADLSESMQLDFNWEWNTVIETNHYKHACQLLVLFIWPSGRWKGGFGTVGLGLGLSSSVIYALIIMCDSTNHISTHAHTYNTALFLVFHLANMELETQHGFYWMVRDALVVKFMWCVAIGRTCLVCTAAMKMTQQLNAVC